MVIDPSSGYNKGGINTSGNASKTKAPSGSTADTGARPTHANSSDSVSLSSQAQKMAKLEAAVNSNPEVNEAHVAKVKGAIENGTYNINPHAIAEKMLHGD